MTSGRDNDIDPASQEQALFILQLDAWLSRDSTPGSIEARAHELARRIVLATIHGTNHIDLAREDVPALALVREAITAIAHALHAAGDTASEDVARAWVEILGVALTAEVKRALRPPWRQLLFDVLEIGVSLLGSMLAAAVFLLLVVGLPRWAGAPSWGAPWVTLAWLPAGLFLGGCAIGLIVVSVYVGAGVVVRKHTVSLDVNVCFLLWAAVFLPCVLAATLTGNNWWMLAGVIGASALLLFGLFGWDLLQEQLLRGGYLHREFRGCCGR